MSLGKPGVAAGSSGKIYCNDITERLNPQYNARTARKAVSSGETQICPIPASSTCQRDKAKLG